MRIISGCRTDSARDFLPPYSSLAAAPKVTNLTLIGCFQLLFGTELKRRENLEVFLCLFHESRAQPIDVKLSFTVFTDSNNTLNEKKSFPTYAQLIETKKRHKSFCACVFFSNEIHSFNKSQFITIL